MKTVPNRWEIALKIRKFSVALVLLLLLPFVLRLVAGLLVHNLVSRPESLVAKVEVRNDLSLKGQKMSEMDKIKNAKLTKEIILSEKDRIVYSMICWMFLGVLVIFLGYFYSPPFLRFGLIAGGSLSVAWALDFLTFGFIRQILFEYWKLLVLGVISIAIIRMVVGSYQKKDILWELTLSCATALLLYVFFVSIVLYSDDLLGIAFLLLLLGAVFPISWIGTGCIVAGLLFLIPPHWRGLMPLMEQGEFLFGDPFIPGLVFHAQMIVILLIIFMVFAWWYLSKNRAFFNNREFVTNL